jgi:hypothetical protein
MSDSSTSEGYACWLDFWCSGCFYSPFKGPKYSRVQVFERNTNNLELLPRRNKIKCAGHVLRSVQDVLSSHSLSFLRGPSFIAARIGPKTVSLANRSAPSMCSVVSPSHVLFRCYPFCVVLTPPDLLCALCVSRRSLTIHLFSPHFFLFIPSAHMFHYHT